MRLKNFPALRAMAISGILALAACAAGPPAPVVDLTVPNADVPLASTPTRSETYQVKSGDTLYSIAFRHGLDYRELAAWNGIAAPYRIGVGQSLRLSAPAVPPSAPSAPSVAPEPQPGQAVTAAVADHPASAPTSASATAAGAAQPSLFEAVAEPAPAKPVAATAPGANPPPVAATPAHSANHAPVPAALPAAPVAPTQESTAVPQLRADGVSWRWPVEGKVVGTFVAGDQTKQGLDIAGRAGDPVRAAASGEVVYSGNGLIGYGELVIVKHNANFLSAYGHNRKRLVKEGDRVTAGQEIAEMGSSSATRDELHFEIRKNGKPVNPLEYLPAK